MKKAKIEDSIKARSYYNARKIPPTVVYSDLPVLSDSGESERLACEHVWMVQNEPMYLGQPPKIDSQRVYTILSSIARKKYPSLWDRGEQTRVVFPFKLRPEFLMPAGNQKTPEV